MAGSSSPGPVNLGSPHEISMLDLANWIRRLTGSRSRIEFLPRPTDDPTNRRPDISRAMAELGWRPVIDIEAGLARTIDWFRAAQVAAQVPQST